MWGALILQLLLCGRAASAVEEGLRGSCLFLSLPYALGSPKRKYTLIVHNKNVGVGLAG